MYLKVFTQGLRVMSFRRGPVYPYCRTSLLTLFACCGTRTQTHPYNGDPPPPGSPFLAARVGFRWNRTTASVVAVDGVATELSASYRDGPSLDGILLLDQSSFCPFGLFSVMGCRIGGVVVLGETDAALVKPFRQQEVAYKRTRRLGRLPPAGSGHQLPGATSVRHMPDR